MDKNKFLNEIKIVKNNKTKHKKKKIKKEKNKKFIKIIINIINLLFIILFGFLFLAIHSFSNILPSETNVSDVQSVNDAISNFNINNNLNYIQLFLDNQNLFIIISFFLFLTTVLFSIFFNTFYRSKK